MKFDNVSLADLCGFTLLGFALGVFFCKLTGLIP
jgi:hypothetical protein